MGKGKVKCRNRSVMVPMQKDRGKVERCKERGGEIGGVLELASNGV